MINIIDFKKIWKDEEDYKRKKNLHRVNPSNNNTYLYIQW